MCTLALYFQVFADYPIVVAANRDELLERPSDPPVQLGSTPWIWGGRDRIAGGTWLGVNEYGLMAGLLNRQSSHPPDPTRRSRGLLCLDALQYASATQAVEALADAAPDAYNPFTLVLSDPSTTYVLHTTPQRLIYQSLRPGVYLFTNLNVNDPSCPRIARMTPQFEHLAQQTDSAHSPDSSVSPQNDTPLSYIFQQLHTLMSDHDSSQAPNQTSNQAPNQDPRNSLCLHLDGYGTCSSSLIAYQASSQRYTYQFAPGYPCQHTYADIPLPPASLASHPPSTV